MKIIDKISRPALFKDRLREVMDVKKISQSELVNLTKIPKSALSQYLSGAFVPKKDRLSILAKALNVRETWLIGYDVPMRPQFVDADGENPLTDEIMEYISTLSPEEQKAELNRLKSAENKFRPITQKRLPMLGNVACGEPVFASEEHDAYIDVDSNIAADFCLTAKGDSMVNARIFDGDILFVKKQDIVNNGEIAVVLIEDEATVKRVYYDKENNILTLMPENPTHRPMRFEGEKLNQIRILGKIVFGQYNIKDLTK